MVYGAAKYFMGALCVPKQFQPKVSAVMQHIKDEVVAQSTVHTSMKKKDDNNCTSGGHVCNEKVTKKVLEPETSRTPGFTEQFQNPKLSIVMQHLKTEVIPPLSGHGKKIEDDSIIATIEAQIPCEKEFNLKSMDYSTLLRPVTGDSKDQKLSSDQKCMYSCSKSDEVPITQMTGDSFKDEIAIPQECSTELKPDTTYTLKYDHIASTAMNQHFRDAMVSSPAGNDFERPNTEGVPLTCTIQNHCQERHFQRAEDTNHTQKYDHTASTAMNQYYKDQMSSPAGNDFEKPNTDGAPLTCTIQNPCQKGRTLRAENIELKDTTHNQKYDHTASTAAMNQHFTDEMVSSPAENEFKKPNIESVPKSCTIRNTCQEGRTLRPEDVVLKDIPNKFCTNASEMKIKEDVKEKISPLSKKPLANSTVVNNHLTSMMGDHCRVDTKSKAEACDILLKSAGNLKELKTKESTKDKKRFTPSVAPPLTSKVKFAMQDPLNIGVQSDEKINECKVIPKHQREAKFQSNIENSIHSCVCPKPTKHTSKSSAGDSKPIMGQPPKTSQ